MSKLIAAGLLFCIGVIYNFRSAIIDFFTDTSLKTLETAGEFLSQPIQIELWILSLIAIPSILFAFLFCVNLLRSEEIQLDVKRYRSDEFLGVIWNWGYSARHGIVKLIPICPVCSCEIRPTEVSTYDFVPKQNFYCDDCSFVAPTVDGFYIDIEDKVKRKIQKNIRVGTWKEKVGA